MSATAAPAATDRSDFRTVTVGGALVGLVTGVAVVLVVAASRTLAAGVALGGVQALVVLAAGVVVAFFPAQWTAARGTEGIAGAAAVGLVGTVVFSAIDIVLLTPVLAWAASYVGLWAGALAATRFTNPLTMLGVAGAAAAVCGFTSLAIWVRFMRRVPHLLSHHMAPRASEEHRAVAAAD